MRTPPAGRTANSHRELKLARHISATWWYTASGVLFWQAPLILAWVAMLLHVGSAVGPAVVVGVGGIAWIAASVPLVLAYRRDDSGAPRTRWRSLLAPMMVGLGYGVAVWLVTGVWVIAVAPVLQHLVLLHWPRGVRLRVVVAVTLLLVALWIVDTRLAFPHLSGEDATFWWGLGIWTIATPSMTVLSLWWWDVLVSLNRARARRGAARSDAGTVARGDGRARSAGSSSPGDRAAAGTR